MLSTAIGVISGTSMDGIDVALIRTDGEATVERGPGRVYPYPEPLKAGLRALLAVPERARHDPLCELEAAVTAAHGDAIAAFLADFAIDAGDVELIGLHGQTVLHRPEERFTRQLGLGAVIARRFGIACVDGFRLDDVAAGGEGAPLAPLYHAALASGLERPLAVLNLGGVGNLTSLGREGILAFDTGPASALIDDFVRRRLGLPFDCDGRLAAGGRVDGDILAEFLAQPFFTAPAPKSLDRNAFHGLMPRVERLGDADGAATLAALTVHSVRAARDLLPEPPQRWLVTGGGRHNRHLMAAMAGLLGVPVEPVEVVGWDGDTMEAELFAYLAVRCRRRLPISLPTTTGVGRPMTGGRLHEA